MSDSRLAVVGAVTVVLLAMLAMGFLHERHYKERRYRLLTARVDTIERILTEERDS